MCHPDDADEGWCHPDLTTGSMGAISKTSAQSLADISASRLVDGKCRRSQTASIYLTRTGQHLLGFPEPSHSFMGKKNRNVFCHKVLQGLNRLFELRVNEAGGHSVFTSWRFSRFSAWFLYLFYNIWSFYFCCIRPSTQHQEIKHTNQCAAHLLLLSTVCCSVLREAVLWRRPLSSCCPLLTFTDLWPQTTNKRFPQRHCRSPDWSDSW